jgi:hypothetical protein
MTKLVNLLKTNHLSLIAALPQNDPELAKAAVAGGADALQLHVNVRDIGSLAEEKENLVNVLKSVKIPTGLMIGPKAEITEHDISEIKKLGFDFFNIKMDRLPPFITESKGLSKVLGLGSRFTIDVVLGVGKYKADAVDAAIIPSSEFGKELIVGDLQNYISIVMSAGIPVIIPTQRSIHASEVAIIGDTGAKGLMLTSVVTGKTAKKIKAVVQQYRVAIDDIEA